MAAISMMFKCNAFPYRDMVEIHICVSEFDLFGKIICMYTAVYMDAHDTTMFRFLDFHLHSFCNNTLMINQLMDFTS